MKRVTALTGLLALCVASSGCTERYVYVQPQCTPPAMLSMPDIDRGELWDALGDDQYRRLERYTDNLWQMIDERDAVIREVCDAKGAASSS